MTFAVTVSLVDGAGAPISGALVEAALTDSEMEPVEGYTDDAVLVAGRRTRTNGAGVATLNLIANADIVPANTYWLVNAPDVGGPWLIDVTEDGTVEELLAADPEPLGTTALAAHTALENPHGTELDDLTDVDATTPATGRALAWSGTAWVPTDMGTQIELDAETAARAAGDATNAAAISTEASTRGSADTALAASVVVEAALARNADNLTSGTVADARIASTIARDSEVTAAVGALPAPIMADAYAASGSGTSGAPWVLGGVQLAALIAAIPSDGAEVFFRRGFYSLSSTFSIPSNTLVRGEGDGSILKLANNSNTNVLGTATAAVDITITDLFIDGNKANQTAASGNGIAIFGSRVTVHRCHVKDPAGYGIVAFPIGGTYTDTIVSDSVVETPEKDGIEIQGSTRASIVNNVVIQPGYSGIYVWSSTGTTSDVTVTGNVVHGPGQTVAATGIRVDDGVTNVTVTGNVVTNAGTANSYGVAVFSSTANAVSTVTVSGNAVTGANFSAGVAVVKASGVVVDSNTIRATVTGVTVTSTASQVTISANSIVSTTQQGIVATTVTDLAVNANMVKSCGGTAYHGIEINTTCVGVAVTGNRVTSCGAAGILIGAGCYDFTVAGNTCHANRTTGIYCLDALNGSVTGNVCRANGRANVGGVTENGITLFKNTGTCTGIVVTGNRCYDDQGTPTQLYGIRVYGACSGHILADNNLAGNATGRLLIDALSSNINLPGRRFAAGRYYHADGQLSDNTAAPGAGVLVVSPLTVGDSGLTIDQVALEVTAFAASSTVRIVLYSDNGYGLPGVLHTDFGSVDSSASNSVKTITVSPTVKLGAGLYHLGCVPQGGSPTVRSKSQGLGSTSYGQSTGGNVNLLGLSVTGVTGSPPDPFGSPSDYQINVPKVQVRAA